MIQIQFNQADLNRWMRAVDKVQNKAKLWIENEMQRRCATDYFQLVQKNIMTQKYSAGYKPYNERYAKWKYPKGTGAGIDFWILGGDLVRNLQIFKHGGGWVGGIPPGIKDSGGKSWLGPRFGGKGKSKKIAMYGAKAEALRPVFKPTMEEYADDKNGWQKRGREALNYIKGAWA